jgi:hypothetical protein
MLISRLPFPGFTFGLCVPFLHENGLTKCWHSRASNQFTWPVILPLPTNEVLDRYLTPIECLSMLGMPFPRSICYVADSNILGRYAGNYEIHAIQIADSSGKLGLCMQRRSSSKSSAAPLEQSKPNMPSSNLLLTPSRLMQSDHSLNAHTIPQPQRLSPPRLSRIIHLVFHGIYTFESDFCDAAHMVTVISDDADDSLCSLRSRFLFLACLFVV